MERTRWLSNRFKVVVEENLFINNTHVIKGKSRHVTGYVDVSQSKESLIGFIVELVKETEEAFSKKKQ